jgi:hypothetical protein
MSSRLQLALLASLTYLGFVAAIGVWPAVALHTDELVGPLTILLGVVHGGGVAGLTLRKQGEAKVSTSAAPPKE